MNEFEIIRERIWIIPERGLWMLLFNDDNTRKFMFSIWDNRLDLPIREDHILGEIYSKPIRYNLDNYE